LLRFAVPSSFDAVMHLGRSGSKQCPSRKCDSSGIPIMTLLANL
jgi:hypothetical protein